MYIYIHEYEYICINICNIGQEMANAFSISEGTDVWGAPKSEKRPMSEDLSALEMKTEGKERKEKKEKKEKNEKKYKKEHKEKHHHKDSSYDDDRSGHHRSAETASSSSSSSYRNDDREDRHSRGSRDDKHGSNRDNYRENNGSKTERSSGDYKDNEKNYNKEDERSRDTKAPGKSAFSNFPSQSSQPSKTPFYGGELCIYIYIYMCVCKFSVDLAYHNYHRQVKHLFMNYVCMYVYI
jgi:hypothetical protein